MGWDDTAGGRWNHTHMNEILRCAGGSLVLPAIVLNDRGDGGHLVVNPPREVWERSELTREELADWAFLVSAAGQAMLEVLPQLRDGCVNYWEAGNWALNDAALPAGPKSPREHRRVHLHLLGRSRDARHADWRWGESPRFPDYTDSRTWAKAFSPLDANETQAVALRAKSILAGRYRLHSTCAGIDA